VDEEVHRRGLQREVAHRQRQVVLADAVGLVVLGEVVARDGEHEHRHVLRPRLVRLDEAAQGFVERGLVFPGRDDEAPRLLVERRRRPARRFEQAAKLLLLDRPVGEDVRAPALLDHVEDGVLRVGEAFHEKSS